MYVLDVRSKHKKFFQVQRQHHVLVLSDNIVIVSYIIRQWHIYSILSSLHLADAFIQSDLQLKKIHTILYNYITILYVTICHIAQM